MFCSKCGSEIKNDVKFCSMCGSSVSVNVADTGNQSSNAVPTHHEIPKCNYCGNIAPWKVGPILRPMDFVIGVALLLLGFIPGLVYLGVVALIRSNDKNREKICTKCGARNMFTNLY